MIKTFFKFQVDNLYKTQMGNTQCCEKQEPVQFTGQLPLHNTKASTIPPKEVEKSIYNTKPSIITPVEVEKPKSQIYEDVYQEQGQQITPLINNQPENDQSTIPELSPKIKKHLENHKYFEEQFNFQPSIKSFGSQVYVGQLDTSNKIPEGFGKMYKSDGSLYIGEFHEGQAQGQGVYLMPNGSYYSGHFTLNHAEGQGQYWSQELKYKGGFKKNRFQGNGKETGKVHEFQGKYFQGFKMQGTYKWLDEQKNEYTYTGDFNAYGEFNGNGVLSEQKGIYTGEFANNLKHGRGVYKYKNGLRYEGDYKEGIKSGEGIIYNRDDTIAYEGEWKGDMPHGIGYTYGPQNEKRQTRWAYGIDSVFL